MKKDIIKNELYISEFLEVMQSSLPHTLLKGIHPRHCDGFIYILGGKCEYTFSDSTFFTAETGNILYLAKDALYDMKITTEKYSFIFVNFLFLDEDKRQSRIFSFKSDNNLEKSFHQLNIISFGSNQNIATRMYFLYNIYSSLISLSSRQYVSKDIREKMEISAEYILNNLSSPHLYIEQMANKLNLSEPYFRKVFKEYYGVSPNDSIINARINYAKQLLAYNNINLQKISEKSGFSSISYFCRMFKKIAGRTPLEYRKEVKKY